MNRIKKIFSDVSKKSRQKRAAIFREKFSIDNSTKILDIGSETGENIKSVLETTSASPNNVYVADIDADAIKQGNLKFGFHPVLLNESGKLPFDDGFFDIVYCSSVIEHVTIPKGKLWKQMPNVDFKKEAEMSQKKFAAEIRRIGKQYFVQTPARNFPIESHSWLPFLSFVPRNLQSKIMRQANKFWIKKTAPDFNLLTAREMQQLFPEAEIVLEKKLGLVKSIMAIKNTR